MVENRTTKGGVPNRQYALAEHSSLSTSYLSRSLQLIEASRFCHPGLLCFNSYGYGHFARDFADTFQRWIQRRVRVSQRHQREDGSGSLGLGVCT